MTAIRLAGQPRWESVAKEDRSDNFWLEVSWTRVEEVVPDEAVALEKLLAALELNMEQFCRDHDCEDVPEESDDAWDRLSQKFQAATGLTLWPFWNPAGLNRIEPDTGFLVIGAMPADRRRKELLPKAVAVVFRVPFVTGGCCGRPRGHPSRGPQGPVGSAVRLNRIAAASPRLTEIPRSLKNLPPIH